MTLVDLLSTVFERRYRRKIHGAIDGRPITELTGALVGSTGEVSGLALSEKILLRFEAMDDDRKSTGSRSFSPQVAQLLISTLKK
jgi:malonyl-CoA decarboxylase